MKDLAKLQALRKQLSQRPSPKKTDRKEAIPPQADPEAELFSQAMQGVTPLAPINQHIAPLTHPAPVAMQRIKDEKAALAESLSDHFDVESLLETDDRLSWRRDGIGPDVVRKLRRGHWILQDELDLHGATRDIARELLNAFVHDAFRRGLRCIRVIHGKGLGSVGGQPVLKSKVLAWLIQKDEVLALCQARAQDGGAGALVVLLRPTDRVP